MYAGCAYWPHVCCAHVGGHIITIHEFMNTGSARGRHFVFLVLVDIPSNYLFTNAGCARGPHLCLSMLVHVSSNSLICEYWQRSWFTFCCLVWLMFSTILYFMNTGSARGRHVVIFFLVDVSINSLIP